MKTRAIANQSPAAIVARGCATGIIVSALFHPLGLAASEIEEMRATMARMQESIERLQTRVRQLESEKLNSRAAAPPPAPSPAPPLPEAKATKSWSPDPRLPGYVPLPYTPFLVRFNLKPRLDFTADDHFSGDNYRFVPEKLPLEGSRAHGGNGEFNLNANGTQIDVDVRVPDDPGALRLHYQNDFFGSDSSDMKYRLRHAYGEYYNVVAGFTYGVFEDPDGWPDTLDYEGPNSVIFARRALLHYRLPFGDHWRLTLGIEKPDTFVDTNFDSSVSRRSRAPDAGFNLRWEKSGEGHVQLSTIFRSIGAKGDEVGTQHVFGWGVNASAAINLTPKDLLQAWFVYGEGIGGLGNDSGFENTDAAYDSHGRLQALSYFSGLGGYTHHWSDRWRSTLSYGYVQVGNTEGQAADAYHLTHYASANLLYRWTPQVTLGLEGLYGSREVRDGRSGDDFRLQFSVLYSLFDQ